MAHKAFCEANHDRWLSLLGKAQTLKSKWYPLMTERQQQILVLQQHQHGLKGCHDLSQSIGRIPTSTVNAARGTVICPTILPQMQLWVGFEHHRFMLGREALSCQGYPWQSLPSGATDDFTEAFYHDLAGNAFPATSFMALMLSAVLAPSWRCARDAETRAVAEDRSSAIKLRGRSLSISLSLALCFVCHLFALVASW